MSITGELRECIKTANRSYEDTRNPYNDREVLHIVDEELLAIADRIDEQHENIVYEYRREYEDFKSYRDIAYVELPVDADKVPIRVGDTVAIFDHKEAHAVETIELTSRGWFIVAGEHTCIPTNLHHVKPDTWERIIQDAVKLGYADYPTTSYEAELVERCKRLAGE